MTIYPFKAKLITGEEISLSEYNKQVLLIVNTASKCGFTDQYENLEKIYQKYHNNGFTVLGFPCDQFLDQEFSDNHEIQEFCKIRFGVTFPLFEKIQVNGKEAHPLYQFLTEQLPGFLGLKSIKWNFTKFLVDSKGIPIKRYAPTTSIASIEPDILSLLKQD